MINIYIYIYIYITILLYSRVCWKMCDVNGNSNIIKPLTRHITSVQLRLFSPQSIFKTTGMGYLTMNKDGFIFHLP